jgi:hypothetical protein
MFAYFKKLVVFGIVMLLLAGCQAAPTQVAAPSATPEDWDGREVFRAGLVKAEQKALEALPGASMYHLELQIGEDLTSLKGRERVRYTNQEDRALEAVYFQLFPNQEGGKSTLGQVTVDGLAAQPVLEAGGSSARVPLSKPLQPGGRVVIEMDFEVQVPSDAGGNYGLFGYLNEILVLDGFYPAIPVYDGQGWHEGRLPPNSDTTFQDASFYVVKVTAPVSLKLAASGVQVEASQQDGQQVVTFAAGPARDFYLAGSKRFAVTSETVGETKVNSYALEGSGEGSKLALRTAVNAIKDYSQRLGAYPYSEFDLVSTPMQGATGIEYPGITGINMAVYELGTVFNGLPAAAMLEGTVAHEVGHQWFYNMVGNDQMNEPWVDESLTQYITGLYFLDEQGPQGWSGYRGSWESRWERVKREAIPIGLPAGRYQGKEYGAIVYGRGPLFVDALAQKMGQDSFDVFLRNYVQANKWGIGSAAIFRQMAEKQCGCDLGGLFEQWVYGK